MKKIFLLLALIPCIASANDAKTEFYNSCIETHTKESRGLYTPKQVCDCVVDELEGFKYFIEEDFFKKDYGWLNENCKYRQNYFPTYSRDKVKEEKLKLLVCTKKQSFTRNCVVQAIKGKN